MLTLTHWSKNNAAKLNGRREDCPAGTICKLGKTSGNRKKKFESLLRQYDPEPLNPNDVSRNHVRWLTCGMWTRSWKRVTPLLQTTRSLRRTSTRCLPCPLGSWPGQASGSCRNVGDETRDTEQGDILGVVWEMAALEVAGYERHLDDKPSSSYRFGYAKQEINSA